MEPTTPTTEKPKTAAHRFGWGPIAVGLLLAAVVILGGVALFRGDPWGDTGSGLSDRFSIDTQDYQRVNPSLVGYVEDRSFPVALEKVHAVACSGDGEIYVAGDRQIVHYTADGTVLNRIELDAEPTCLAVAGAAFATPGRIFVGGGGGLVVLGKDGKRLANWSEGFDEQSVLTSIALGEQDVFVADAGNRTVLHLDAEGQLIGRIGDPDPDRGIRGFVIPSAHFDVATTPDGLLCVVNPGARRIETFTYEGDLLGHWGIASAAIDGFFGCCNPSNLAVLPDGRFVTAEKGIPRIKVYTKDGEFQSVVADPETLGQTVTKRQLEEDSNETPVFDVAIMDDKQVVVLDPANRRVRVFKAKES